MSRSRRMKRISDLAELSKRTASLRLGDSQRRFEGDRARLEEFRRYRLEYANALYDGAALTASSAREIRNFIGQLDRTIAALETQVARSEQTCASDRSDWQDQSRRTRAIADVLARCERDDGRREERAGQREADERGANGRVSGDPEASG